MCHRAQWPQPTLNKYRWLLLLLLRSSCYHTGVLELNEMISLKHLAHNRNSVNVIHLYDYDYSTETVMKQPTFWKMCQGTKLHIKRHIAKVFATQRHQGSSE